MCLIIKTLIILVLILFAILSISFYFLIIYKDCRKYNYDYTETMSKVVNLALEIDKENNLKVYLVVVKCGKNEFVNKGYASQQKAQECCDCHNQGIEDINYHAYVQEVWIES